MQSFCLSRSSATYYPNLIHSGRANVLHCDGSVKSADRGQYKQIYSFSKAYLQDGLINL